MKLILLLSLFFISSVVAAQNSNPNNLPSGRYETMLKQSQNKWDQGDIILVDGSHYKITSNDEIGEYKFSSTAQRVFFKTGPLKNFSAKTSLNNNQPAIVLPVAENAQIGVGAEVWCYHKQ